jgi:GTP-sensing pleiotropic transcriptional regulator CodY
MVNNSSNINKSKESLNSDGQQFLQYQQTKRNFEQWWSTIPLISSKQRKFEQWRSTIPPISTNQKKVLTVMVNNSSNTNKPKESLNSDGQQFYQYQQTKRKFEQWWSTIPPISTNQKKVLTVMVNNSTNINKPKESFNSDGQQFYQYQQNKRKF